MVGITQAHAEQQLAAWLTAEATLSTTESYTITTSAGTRQLTRYDLAEVRKQIDYWERKALRRSRGGLAAVGIIPNG